MSLRGSLLAVVLLFGCKADPLVTVEPADGSGGPGLDMTMPRLADLASLDQEVVPDLLPNLATVVWIRQFGSENDDRGWGVATDGMGNVYVTGFTHSGLDGNQVVGGYSDAFLVKYDAQGDKLWTRQFGTPGSDEGHHVATDGAGNVYVTGYTENAGQEDAFLVKYDTNGNRIWTRQFGTQHADWADGVATDGMGNVYVSGSTGGGLDGNQKAGLMDAFLVKYDTNGNKLWTRQFGTVGINSPNGVAADQAGHIYVVGTTGLGFVDDDAFLVKYDANGKLWTRRLLGTAAVASGVALDGSGGIYVAGSTEYAFAGNQNAGGGWDAFLARLSAAP